MSFCRATSQLPKPRRSPCILCTARDFAVKAKSTPRFARAATEAQSKTGSNGGKSVGDVLRQPDFKQVAKAGFLKANPGTAEAILLNLVGRKEINGKVIEELAAQYKVPLIAFTAIARFLLRQQLGGDQRDLASRILNACSEAKEPIATIGLVRVAQQTKQLRHPHFQAPMARMAELVRDKHPRALKLQAEMLEGQHKAREALKMYEEAIKSAAEGRTQGETLEESAMDQIGRAPDERESATDGAWTAIGRIYLHELRDLEKAKSAFQEGALKADDPEAYHLLARFEIEDSEFPIYTEQYVEYETKAAASGHPEAALALANFYAMSPEESKVKTTPAAWKMFDQAGDMTEQGRLQWARQWCELACETPPVYPQAMLLYLKISIQLDDAKSALAKAREWVEYVSDFPPQLRKMWQEVARTLGDEQLAG